MKAEKYKTIYPSQAALMFNKKQYEKWLDIRCKLIAEWHKNKENKIEPCMLGVHYMNGIAYEVKTTDSKQFFSPVK